MKIVAIKEKADGNESVGTMWLETKIFEEDVSVGEIIRWSQNGTMWPKSQGRLIISVPDNDEGNKC